MLIAGAGGFAKETLELLLQLDYPGDIFFYDDVNPENRVLFEVYQVIKTVTDLEKHFAKDPTFCVGIGNAKHREVFHNKMLASGGRAESIISPFARIGRNGIKIGEGSIIATGTVIPVNVSIGRGTLINSNCTIGHDNFIDEFCELAPGVHICGGCRVGRQCEIGTGAVLVPGIVLGDRVKIGAGTVVRKNVPSDAIVIGNQPRPSSYNSPE